MDLQGWCHICTMSFHVAAMPPHHDDCGCCYSLVTIGATRRESSCVRHPVGGIVGKRQQALIAPSSRCHPFQQLQRLVEIEVLHGVRDVLYRL